MLAVRARCLEMFISLLCLVTVHLLRLPGVTRRPFYRYCRLHNCMLSPYELGFTSLLIYGREAHNHEIHLMLLTPYILL